MATFASEAMGVNAYTLEEISPLPKEMGMATSTSEEMGMAMDTSEEMRMLRGIEVEVECLLRLVLLLDDVGVD